MQANRFDIARLRDQVRPFRLYWAPVVASTNSLAARKRRAGELFAPAIVLAGRQIKGRGRAHKAWWSGPGCLTVTFALPLLEQFQPQQIPLIAGLLVRNVAARLCNNHAIKLKWPNDLLYGRRKLAGVLCERTDRLDLIGVGLNVNISPRTFPVALREHVTSLAQIAGCSVDINDVLIALAQSIHACFLARSEKTFAQFLKEFEQHHALLGESISVVDGMQKTVRGVCAGVDSLGRLRIRSGAQELRIVAGEVSLDR